MSVIRLLPDLGTIERPSPRGVLCEYSRQWLVTHVSPYCSFLPFFAFHVPQLHPSRLALLVDGVEQRGLDAWVCKLAGVHHWFPLVEKEERLASTLTTTVARRAPLDDKTIAARLGLLVTELRTAMWRAHARIKFNLDEERRINANPTDRSRQAQGPRRQGLLDADARRHRGAPALP